MKTKTCASLTLVLLLALPARLFAADGDLVITGFNSSGEMRWTHTATSGTYSVEWSAAAGGAWSRSWTPLVGIPATGTDYVAQVPMVYRVVFNPATNVSTLRTLTNRIAIAQDGLSTYSGTLGPTPVIPGSLTITAGAFVLVDNGGGALSGSGRTGAVDYATGAWSIDLLGEWPPDGSSILGSFTFNPVISVGQIETQINDVIAVEASGQSRYSGTLHMPVTPGSLTVTAGSHVLVDNGSGTLSGGNKTGSINYQTGAWSIDLQGEWPPGGSAVMGHYAYCNQPLDAVPVWDSLQGYGVAGQHSYTGTLYTGTNYSRAVVPDTLWISCNDYDFADNGSGLLTGAGGSGTINYWTGAWTLNMALPSISQDEPISANFDTVKCAGQQMELRSQIVAFGIAGKHTYSGTLQYSPVVTGSFHLTAGSVHYTDNDGDGVLTGTAGTTGTVSYATGAWSIDLDALEVTAGRPIIVSYTAVVN